MERYYGDCADSFRDLKKEILVDLSWDIEKVFGAHVRPKYKEIRDFFRYEAHGYIVSVYEKTAELEFVSQEMTFKDFLWRRDLFNEALAEFIGDLVAVEFKENKTGVFGRNGEYKHRKKMRIISESIETLAVLQSYQESRFGFTRHSISIRPPRHSVQGNIYDFSLERVYYGYTEEKKGEVATEIGIGWLYLPNFLDSIGCPIGDEKRKTPGQVLDYLLKNYVDRNNFANICGNAGVTAFKDLKSAKDRFRREGFTGKFSYGAAYIDRLDRALNLEPGNFFEVNPPETPAKKEI